MKKKSWIILSVIILLAVLCAGIYAHGVYNGWFLLNNPSKNSYPVRGVDVSHYQGKIDWERLSQNDIEFAYIKATEGSSHLDPEFAANWQNARETRLAAGAYHFFSFDSSGKTQAENFIASIGAEYTGMLAPVVDVEYYADKKENPPSVEAVYNELLVMLILLEQEYQVRPIIYTTEDVWQRYIKEQFPEYPLWIRNVMTKPRLGDGYPWILWQYTNREKLEGYYGEEEFIDMNVYAEDRQSWQLFLEENTVK